jgi:hypothetical protein
MSTISSWPKCLCLGMVAPAGSSSAITTKRSEPLFFGLTFNMNGTAAEGRGALCEGAPDSARRTRSSPSFFSSSNGLALAVGAHASVGAKWPRTVLYELRQFYERGRNHPTHLQRVHPSNRRGLSSISDGSVEQRRLRRQAGRSAIPFCKGQCGEWASRRGARCIELDGRTQACRAHAQAAMKVWCC